jgi:hypothetical protein
MLLAGDEFGQTQRGNNNAYCHDDEISWLDWSLLHSERGAKLHAFATRLIALRKNNSLLQPHYFQHGQHEWAPGVRDVLWFDERGYEMQPADWNNSAGRLLGLRRAAPQGDDRVAAALLLSNSDGAAHEFLLPPPHFDYCIMVDTQRPDCRDEPVQNNRVTVAPHSFVLLLGSVALQDIQSAQQRIADAQAELHIVEPRIESQHAAQQFADADEELAVLESIGESAEKSSEENIDEAGDETIAEVFDESLDEVIDEVIDAGAA